MKGRGIAIGGFANTHVAVVADIEVNKKTGKIRVQHLYRRARLRPDRQPGHGRTSRSKAA